MRASPPPAHVADMFGGVDAPVPLSGGRGTAWRCGEVVLKPLDMSERALRWQAEALIGLDSQDDVRIGAPIPARDGSWTAAGWTAWHYLPGEHAFGRWREILAAGERFHAAIRHLGKPAFLDDRDDDWAIADRVAWGELPIEDYLQDSDIARLAGRLAPVPLENQVVHGDLTGNVLLHPTLPPAIIDLSPYWRPPQYATAVVIADALMWHGADQTVLRCVGHVHDFPQFLLRAMIFRLVTDRRIAAREGRSGRRYVDAVDVACRTGDG